MKILKIVLFLILGFNANSQIELFQLQWATDSSYVIGSLPSGEPIWVHRDSLGFGRIYDYNVTSVYYYDIINPQKGDIYIDDQYDSSGKNRYYDGSTWQIFDYDGYVGNEGRLYVLDGTSYNTARIRSYHGDYTDAVLKGDSLVKVNSVFDSNILDITIDTVNLLDLTTQYLNPYVVTGDTVGFYLTVAVDTVLFENTIDTAAYCCPPSLSGDTLYIEDNYVVLPVANIIGGWGIDATESPANTWNIIADTSQVATQYDLGLKFTLPSFTNGSILFSNGTTIAQDNTNLFWDDTNNELEIRGIPIGRNATDQLYAGIGAGNGATLAEYSNFFGNNSGNGATNAVSSNFFGLNAGNGATDASYSNFYGNGSGYGATSALSSNFFGNNSGNGATNSSYSNFFGFKTGMSFSGNNLGSNNIIIGKNISLPNATTNAMNLGGVLFGTGFQSSTSGNPKIVVTSAGKIGVKTINPVQTFDVTGTARITGSDGTSTTIMGRDADGDISAITASYGVNLSSNILTVDTTSSNGLVTQYDLTQVSGGSSKTIDILGSDFTTSATSLQSTALTYTFPSTGTYEVKIYGSYTCSNTANGLSIGWIDSGGLVASYITGKHSAFTNNSSSSSTEFRKPISAIGTTLATASVNASSTPYTLISETLITVSTAGTITYGFASGSGSYSATLQAGSSLIVEKLN